MDKTVWCHFHCIYIVSHPLSLMELLPKIFKTASIFLSCLRTFFMFMQDPMIEKMIKRKIQFDLNYFCRMVDRQIKSCFQPGQLSEAFAITNLQHNVSWTAKNLSSDFKFCSIDSHYVTAPFFSLLLYLLLENYIQAIVRCQTITILIFILIIIFAYFDFWNHCFIFLVLGTLSQIKKVKEVNLSEQQYF